jgi:hypothetical protein
MNRNPIPGIVHFVYGMCSNRRDRPFSFVHYVAFRSALEVHQPAQLILHTGYEPSGPWWDAISPAVQVRIVTPPTSIHGNPVDRPEHRSDLVRLDALLEFGGLYLDMDTISVRSIAKLRIHRCVLGEERTPGSGSHGLSNAVMMAERHSHFLTRWKRAYSTFNQAYWNTHSVVLPRLLAKQSAPGEVHTLPVESFHWPSWDDQGVSLLFEEDHTYPDAYVHHLWAGKTWDSHLSSITPNSIWTSDTTYYRLARRFVPKQSW